MHEKDYHARIAIAGCMQFLRNDAASFAETASGYLQPDSDRVSRYREIIRAKADNRKPIAINWRSFSEENGAQRSIPLMELLVALPPATKRRTRFLAVLRVSVSCQVLSVLLSHMSFIAPLGATIIG